VAEARGPDLQTMELRWGDQTEPERPKPHDMSKDPLKYTRNMSAETGGGEGGGAKAKPKTPAPS
jgi:hypothetical protein